MKNRLSYLFVLPVMIFGSACGETTFPAESPTPDPQNDTQVGEVNRTPANSEDRIVDVDKADDPVATDDMSDGEASNGGETNGGGTNGGGSNIGGVTPVTLEGEPIHYFSNGFEGNVELSFDGISAWQLTGADPNYTGIADWAEATQLGIFELAKPRNNHTDFATYALVNDPDDNVVNNRVLMLHSIDDDPVTGATERAQLELKPDQSDGPFRHFFVKLRWFIPEDYAQFANMPGGHKWMNYLEFWWNNIDGCPDSGTNCNPAGSFRIFLYFSEINDSGKFQWRVNIQDMEGPKAERLTQYYYEPNVPVPFGEWMDIEVLLVEGEDPSTHPDSQSRYIVFMGTESLGWKTLFDVRDARLIPKYGASGIKILHILKNYMNKDNMVFMNSDGREAKMYYDNIEIWDRCPEHSRCYEYLNPPE